MSAKPLNATAADKRRAERLWQLYQLAFTSLIRPHRRSSASRYEERGDRAFEAAQDVAHLAMTLAVAAAAKWEAHAQRIRHREETADD